MASSPLRSIARFHARSISLPTRSLPLIPQFDEHLCRFRASEATSSASSSASSRLSGLETLYDCVGNLLLLPHTRQVFAQDCHHEWVNEALDGYVRLLDVCGTVKDVLSQTKQDAQEFLSILRRRRDTNHSGRYLATRKKARKVIQKLLKDLKSIKNKGHATDAAVSMLNEVEAAAVDVLESLLFYIAGQSRPGRSLISKLMHQRSVAVRDQETDANEFEKADALLRSLIRHNTSKSGNIDFEDVQSRLGNLELSIQGLEEGVESLFRRLIRTRASILNILNG